jgi:AcrR family transcriptional regulator
MARSPSVTEDQLLARIADVFREAGYDGASLGALAAATGLQRASLYHRFPDGKAQMAEAVLEHVRRSFEWLLEPMRTAPDARAGIAESAGRIGEFYGGGMLSCVLDTLPMSGAPAPVRAKAAEVADLWITTMADAAQRGGRPRAEAQAAAQDAFVQVLGGLVYGRLFSNREPFGRALDRLPGLLLGPERVRG